MEAITAIEKLHVLLPHWIGHNQSHEAEFRKWAAAARAEGGARLAILLDKAAENMAATDALLKAAGAEAGAPPAPHQHAHHGHAHHDHGHAHHDHDHKAEDKFDATGME